MKFTLGWLRDHLDSEADLAQILDALTMIGLEVEGVRDPARDLSSFTIAAVAAVAPHPQADRLSVCSVAVDPDPSSSRLVPIVCGAPNVRVGLRGVFAPVGCLIPASGKRLDGAVIRGVESQGMLCSEWELGLSDDHDRIIELPDDAPLGALFASYAGLDDPVIDIAVTPNRGDCLGVRGIARDLAAAGLGTLKADKPVRIDGRFDSPVAVACDGERNADGDESAPLCPLFAARLIRNLSNGPSPDWLKKRLNAVGQRSINRIVDVTNFINLDRARPLHAYDADKIGRKLEARPARPGESFDALNGKTYRFGDHDGDVCVIADDKRIQGLGGVIGGAHSAADDKTSSILLESALFDPIAVSVAGRRFGIDSEARHRFERRVDPAAVKDGLDRAVQMILDLCGGEASHMIVAGRDDPKPHIIAYDPDFAARCAGCPIAAEEQFAIFKRLGFAIEAGSPEDRRVAVAVPPRRHDVTTPACLVEETVRLIGFDRIPAVPLPQTPEPAAAALPAAEKQRRLARRVIASRGYAEAITWSFIAAEDAAALDPASEPIVIRNPLSRDQTTLRPGLVFGLAAAAARNRKRAKRDFAVFELGPRFTGVEPEDQHDTLAGLRVGAAAGSRHWRQKRDVDAHDAKADCFAVLHELGVAVEACRVDRRGLPVWLHPQRAGAVFLGPKRRPAVFGELHPDFLRHCDLDAPAVAFEIALDALPPVKNRKTTQRPPLAAYDLHPIRRDLAFVVNAAVTAQDIVAAAKAALRKENAEIAVFDIFKGKPLAKDEISIAVEITLQPVEKSPTEDEIRRRIDDVVKTVGDKTGARLR